MIKNRYVKRAKISEAKFRQLIRLFAYDLDAKTIASLTHLNRNTVNRYFALIRKRIAEFCEQQSPVQGEIEVDESYFGGKRIKGKRGRGAYKKTPVFGIFKRGGKVYTEIVPDCAKATLQGIIRGRVKILTASSIQMDGAVITALLTSAIKSITESTMDPISLLLAKVILTA